MKYIDANPFIYVFTQTKRSFLYKKSFYYLNRIQKKKIQVGTCPITWDEIFYIILQKNGRDSAITAGKYFLEFPNLVTINVTLPIIEKAQEIVENYDDILPRDAIHAAASIILCNGELISNDHDFDAITEINRNF